MRRVKGYTITKESPEDQVKIHRFNPCLEITFQDREGEHKHKISDGYSDEIHVFRNQSHTLVLSFNSKLGYVGLEAFQGDEKMNDVFLSGSEMLAAFGENDLEPSRMIRILQEWL